MNGLVTRLISRGDVVAVNNGRLFISPVSGSSVPKEWLKKNQHTLDRELALISGLELYKYESSSTGNYGPKKSGGLTLQFVNLLTGEFQHVIFNVETKRQRSTSKHKAGSSYPKGHFSVSKRSKFYEFWLSTLLPVPKSLTRFHKELSKLKTVYFLMPPLKANGNVESKVLPLFNFSYDEITQKLGHNFGIEQTQVRHKPDTITRHKDSVQSQGTNALQENKSTCSENHVISKQGSAYISNNALADTEIELNCSKLQKKVPKPPEEQTVEEWIADYDNATSY